MEGIDITSLSSKLFERIEKETERILKEQKAKLDVSDRDKVKQFIYPDDPKTLCTYEIDGRLILGVRATDNAVVFDVPTLEAPDAPVPE